MRVFLRIVSMGRLIFITLIVLGFFSCPFWGQARLRSSNYAEAGPDYKKIEEQQGVYGSVISDLLKPQMIKVDGDELFVVQEHTVLVYSLQDMKLKFKIGKAGAGPGEFKLDPSRTLIIHITDNYIIGESRGKVIYFNRKGKYVKELKKKPGTLQCIPVGKNYLVHRILAAPEGKTYFSLWIYSEEMEPIKELYRQKFFTFQTETHVMPDSLNYTVNNRSIFIEKSPDGFLIDEYDFSGDLKNSIRKKHTPISVKASERDAAMKDYLSIPFFRRAERERGKAWIKNLMNSMKIVYPDNHYPIQDVVSDGQSLFVRIPTEKRKSTSFIELDFKGKELKRHLFPEVRKVDFLVQMQGDKKYYTIHNRCFYYLECNDDEEWQLKKVRF